MAGSKAGEGAGLAYDRIAQVYLGMAGSSESQRKAKERIDWLASQVKGETILDIGCSEGILPVLLGRNKYKVTGIDINPAAIEYARELILKEEPEVQERVTFHCISVFSFEPDGQLYDTVVLGEVIEHFETPEAVISQALTFLKPDGLLLITTPFGHFPDPGHKQTFTLRSFIQIFHKRVMPISMAVVDGYIRFAAVNRKPNESDLSLFTDEHILTLTEQAAIDEQKRYHSLLGEQINETRAVHLERKSLEAKTLKQQQDLNRLGEQIKQISVERDQLQAALDRARDERDQLQTALAQARSELDQTKSNLNKLIQDLKQTREHLSYYMDQFSRYRDAFVDMENSVAYRVGNSLKLAVVKPGKNTLLLPYTMVKLFVHGVKRIANRHAEAPRAAPILPVQPPGVKANVPRTLDVGAGSAIRKHEASLMKKRREKKTQFELDPAVKHLRDLKVACVMDAFTFYSFAPECNLLQLTPKNWRAELEDFQPHMLVIESAWQGKDQLWYRQVDRCSQEIQAVIEWCTSKGIPTVFWNKEDPVHFDTFIQTASLFDFVFTTDIDAVRKYKSVCGTDRAFLLPFAAQPAVHNPVEKYNRKNAFCFAGAYYARYPERRHDFETFAGAIGDKWGLEIYDRNQFPDNPDYVFPEKYQKYIVGSLPPERIDVAYKEYRYGINMNSIKQSQTMFARRVFELLASNTVTVSNYSRGVRNLFGDLVICTDDGNQLSSEIEHLMMNETYYRKYRLAGLRKVMREETYHDRLAYIVAKVFRVNKREDLPPVAIFANVSAEKEVQNVLSAFSRQNYAAKRLVLITDTQNLSSLQRTVPDHVTCLSVDQAADTAVSALVKEGFVAVFSPYDYYGTNYLLDLCLSTRYVKSPCIGKHSMYALVNGSVELLNDGAQYRFTDNAAKRSSVVRVEMLKEQTVESLLADVEAGHYVFPGACFMVDEFNYCRGFDGERLDLVEDLDITDQGISSTRLMEYAETLTPKETDLLTFEGEQLGQLFQRRKEAQYEVIFYDRMLDIASSLASDMHQYIYSNQWLVPTEFHLDNQIVCKFLTVGNLDIQLALIWFNANKEKLCATMVKPGSSTNLDIPENAAFLRLALRIKGKGHGSVRSIRFCKGSDSARQSWVSKSDTLLVTNIYPAYDNLYRNAFVHRRVKGYKKKGLLVDVLRMDANHPEGYEEFQGLDIVTGSAYALESALASGNYSKVLVHFLNDAMWGVLKKYLGKVKVIIWIHGAEIQPWWRREFDFTSPEEKDRAVSESVIRQSFWNEVFSHDQTHLHYVFVSKYFANEVAEDYKLDLTNLNYSIIHNFVDTDLFDYQPKSSDDRKRILGIRPFANRKYANDLTAKAIIELSTRPFFKELEFRIIGDGRLFEETVAPLRSFDNVILEKRFLPQDEIARLHKDYGLFLTPTRMDAQGVSRDEAMSSGLVPLTNEVAAIPEFVDETCAILAQAEDYLALANGIEFLYKNPDEFLRMSQAAAERVRKQTSFVHTIAKEIELIKG